MGSCAISEKAAQIDIVRRAYELWQEAGEPQGPGILSSGGERVAGSFKQMHPNDPWIRTVPFVSASAGFARTIPIGHGTPSWALCAALGSRADATELTSRTSAKFLSRRIEAAHRMEGDGAACRWQISASASSDGSTRCALFGARLRFSDERLEQSSPQMLRD
jgi:hypothetical protein